MFYAMSRGLDSEAAVALIVNGFAREVLQQLPMEFAVEAQTLLGISLEGSVGRPEERRVGKGCVSPCRSRLSPSHSNNQTEKRTSNARQLTHKTCIGSQSITKTNSKTLDKTPHKI